MTAIEVTLGTQTIDVDPQTQTIIVNAVTGVPIVVGSPAATVTVVQSGPIGPPGAKGLKGDQGNTGPQGLTGPQGIRGIKGDLGPKGDKGDIGSIGPTGLTGAQGPIGLTGERGPTGFTGATGPSGSTGPAGAAGAPGLDGKTILHGSVNPTTEGVNGDYYINDTTHYIFGPRANAVWPAGISLVGPTGPQGIQGIQGIQGPQGNAAGFDFVQASPLSTWTINHNLGYKPSVQLFTVGGLEVIGEILHTSVNQVQVSFNDAISGSARLI